MQCADLLDHTHHNQTGAGQGAELETPEVQYLLGLDRRGTYVVSESVEKVGSGYTSESCIHLFRSSTTSMQESRNKRQFELCSFIYHVAETVADFISVVYAGCISTANKMIFRNS